MRKLFLACLLLAGCAGGAPYMREPLPPGAGVVYVYRTFKFQGAGWNGHGTVVHSTTGQARSFKIRTSKYVATVVAPGRIVFTTNGADNHPVSLLADVPPGGAAFIRCEFEMGMWVNGMRCEGLPSQVAEPEIMDTKKNELGD
jgi:hypothetical protein